MSLRWRLFLLMGLLALLPGIFAAVVTKQLIGQSLDVGLSPDLDRAVETGLRHSAQLYRHERDAFRRVVGAWAASVASASDVELGSHLRALRPPEIRPGDRIEWVSRGGDVTAIQAGDIGEIESSRDNPPSVLLAVATMGNGRELRAERPVDPRWRADAAHLQGALQILRVAQENRENLERSFWIPFLLIYGATLLIAALASWGLGRGIVGPVDRLVAATERVAAGDWDVRVESRGPGELSRLTDGFNHMVNTLDAQSRSLVELEKMAGWREMARTLAHEVKNPLTPIQLTVEEIERRYEGDDAKYRALLSECTRIVIEEVESLRNVVERFREFSRPVELRPVASNLNGIVADVAALQRDLHSTTDLDAELGEVDVDPDRLRQLLMNLAENARNVLGQAGGRLHFVTRRLGDDRVKLRVEDDGPGIAEEERDRIFEPYKTGRAGGLGLGMALAKGIVLAHHGEIRVEESNWGGAAIVLELPRHQPTEGEGA